MRFVKLVQTRAIRACSYIAECRLTYAKLVQTRAMRACSCIAERRLTYAKLQFYSDKCCVYTFEGVG